MFVLSLEALDMKAFVNAVKKILSHVTDEMLELLFLKVDTDCNGLVTWVRRAPPLPQVAEGRLEGPALAGQGSTWRVEDGGRHNIRKPPVDSGGLAGQRGHLGSLRRPS